MVFKFPKREPDTSFLSFLPLNLWTSLNLSPSFLLFHGIFNYKRSVLLPKDNRSSWCSGFSSCLLQDQLLSFWANWDCCALWIYQVDSFGPSLTWSYERFWLLRYFPSCGLLAAWFLFVCFVFKFPYSLSTLFQLSLDPCCLYSVPIQWFTPFSPHPHNIPKEVNIPFNNSDSLCQGSANYGG